jgi:uncharacterized protein
MTRFAGYAAIFDAPDKGGDVIRKGAFRNIRKAPLPLLSGHDPAKRIGTVEHLCEDDHGLRIIARLDGSHAVTSGAGLSFGYRVKRGVQRRFRELLDLDLIEVSLVDHPMQPLAKVLAVEG